MWSRLRDILIITVPVWKKPGGLQNMECWEKFKEEEKMRLRLRTNKEGEKHYGRRMLEEVEFNQTKQLWEISDRLSVLHKYTDKNLSERSFIKKLKKALLESSSLYSKEILLEYAKIFGVNEEDLYIIIKSFLEIDAGSGISLYHIDNIVSNRIVRMLVDAGFISWVGRVVIEKMPPSTLGEELAVQLLDSYDPNKEPYNFVIQNIINYHGQIIIKKMIDLIIEKGGKNISKMI